MERRNRRMLLQLGVDPPSWTAATSSTENIPLSPSSGPTSISSTITTTTRHKLQPPPTMDALFSSSLAVTVLVLLSALFFLVFTSLCIRRFAEESSNARDDDNDNESYHRQVRPPMNSHPPLPLRQSSCAAIHKGLDPVVIGSLPTCAYSGTEKYQMECSVCLSEFEEGETIKVIPHYRHVFHVHCIDRWLYSHVSCPVCRASCVAN